MRIERSRQVVSYVGLFINRSGSSRPDADAADFISILKTHTRQTISFTPMIQNKKFQVFKVHWEKVNASFLKEAR